MQDTVEQVLSKPKYKRFTITGANAKATCYWSRTTRNVHVRLEQAGRAETVVFPTTGDEEIDEKIVFLLLLSWSRTAQFKLNTTRRSPAHDTITYLKKRYPHLTSNDPMDAIITNFLLHHKPVSVLLPAGREYASLVPRLMRAGLPDVPSMEELEDTGLADNYVEKYRILLSGYARVEDDDPGTLYSPSIARKLFSKYYPDVMRHARSVLLFREMLGDLPRIFVYEHVISAVSNIERTSRAVDRLVSKYTGGRMRARFRKMGADDYRLIIEHHAPGVEPAGLIIGFDTGRLVELFYDALRRSELFGSMRGVYGAILEVIKDTGPVETLKEKETLLFLFEPGRLYVLGEDGRVLGFNSFEAFRTGMAGTVRSDLEGPFSFDRLDRLGDKFYGSRKLRRAVSITGCITCTDYELVNENVALATDGKTWHAGLLIGSTTMRATGRDPKTALLGLTDMPTMYQANVENIEKYAPEIVSFRRAVHVIDREARKNGKALSFEKDPVAGTITYRLNVTEKPVMLVLPAERVDEDEWEPVSVLDSKETWERLLPAPDYVVRALVENGFKRKPKRRTRMIYRNGNIYVLLRR